MRDVLPELMQWWEAGETIGVGTVVATFRSAPRPPGASMLVGPDGGPALGLGRVEDHQPPQWPDEGGRKQFHLDLAVADIDASAARAVELGASVADPQPGDTWRVLIDPAGHPFCLTDAANWG